MLSQEGYFRALIGAVTLKHSGERSHEVWCATFPRLNRRGHIEAYNKSRDKETTPDFRALIGAVTLKRGLGGVCDQGRHRFPRLNRRGHIEASIAPSPLTAPAEFPRLNRRGHIEAENRRSALATTMRISAP